MANQLGIVKDGTRGKLNCQLFGLVASSAHCLRFSELKYHSFQLGLPEKKFDISIEIESNTKQIVPPILSYNTN